MIDLNEKIPEEMRFYLEIKTSGNLFDLYKNGVIVLQSVKREIILDYINGQTLFYNLQK